MCALPLFLLFYETNLSRKSAWNFLLDSQVESGDLIAYGLIPEFIGRFPISVSLSALNEDPLVTPQILGNPELDLWSHVKGLTLRVTPIHIGNQSKHLNFFFFVSIKCLILNKFIKLRFTVTYYFIFPKPTITLSPVHKYNKSTNNLSTQKLKYL